jgi:hypothetical protein
VMLDDELVMLNEAIKAGKITNPDRIRSIRCDLIRGVVETHENRIAEFEQVIDECLDALRIARARRDDAKAFLKILESE